MPDRTERNERKDKTHKKTWQKDLRVLVGVDEGVVVVLFVEEVVVVAVAQLLWPVDLFVCLPQSLP